MNVIANLIFWALSIAGHRYHAIQRIPRIDAQIILDQSILPSNQYGSRIGLGTRAQNLKEGIAVKGTDPKLYETYGEFPLASLDAVLDRTLKLRPAVNKPKVTKMIDLGSGCGRLAMYMALTRENWDVHGIEISRVYHDEAEQAMQSAIVKNLFTVKPVAPTKAPAQQLATSTLTLHLGPANEFLKLLKEADLIFCYSTAFRGGRFSETAGAMLLDGEWNELLAICRSNCLCVTTDKALDDAYDWHIVDRLDVPNPEVWESTAFIHSKGCR